MASRWVSLVVVMGSLAACQPMYGAKPDKLHAPSPIAHVVTVDPIPPPVYVETCQVDFRNHVKTVHRDPVAAARLVSSGNTHVATAERATEPATRADHLRQSMDNYREALIKDPFDPEATMRLALAYDRVLHKGCALALLQRLALLSTNQYPQAAERVDEVADTTSWFSGYRSAALAAIGH